MRTRNTTKREVEYNGITYASKKELAKAADINYNSLIMRLQRGYTISNAIRQLKKKQFVYGGKRYSCIKDAVKENSTLCYGTVISRIRRLDWDLDKAMTRPSN